MAIEKKIPYPALPKEEMLPHEDMEREIELPGPTGERVEGDIDISVEDEDGNSVPLYDDEGTSMDFMHTDNLAEFLDDDDLQEISSKCIEDYQNDKSSIQEWYDIIAEAHDLLGFKIENLTEPFEGACGAAHPLLAESIIKYQAKARRKIVPPEGPVRTKIVGKKTPEKVAQAQRVREYMNYLITKEMKEYSAEHDRLLFYQAFYGMGFTKVMWDEAQRRPVCRMVKPQEFFVDYYASDLTSAQRCTQLFSLSQDELVQYQMSGLYRDDIDLSESNEEIATQLEEKVDEVHGRMKPSGSNERFSIIEMHTYYDMPGDQHTDENGEPTGLARPYIVTVDLGSNKILSIYRNWEENDPLFKKLEWFVAWPFIPGLGFYGYGYAHLIGGLAKATTSSLRQLIDAGTFANLPGGLKTTGMRLADPDAPIKPGEWRNVNTPSIDLTKSLMPLPYKEPSATLVQLMEFVVTAAQRFADSTEQVVSESTNYGPVGTTMALLESSGQLFSAIHERLFEFQRQELEILERIIVTYMPDDYPYDVGTSIQGQLKVDFGGEIDILPVTDPRIPSEAQRIAKANAQLEVASRFPQAHNIRNLLFRMHQALGEDNPEDILAPPPQKAKPYDPITENMAILTGDPVATAEHQDHEAHIAVHLLIVQDPVYAKDEMVALATHAHVQEHLAWKFRTDIQRLMGMPLPPMGTEMPPEIEAEISRRAMEAGRVLLGKDVAEARAIEVGAIENDPEYKLKKEELAVKARDVEYDMITKMIDTIIDAKLQEKEIQAKLVIASKKAEEVKARNAQSARKKTES